MRLAPAFLRVQMLRQVHFRQAVGRVLLAVRVMRLLDQDVGVDARMGDGARCT
jgi:hypothetical protein